MSDQAGLASGGVVIPFPAMRRDAGQERLDRALAGLLRATQEQAAAVATWRGALADLDQTMAGLAGSVGRYQSALTETAARVEELGGTARRLEASLGG